LSNLGSELETCVGSRVHLVGASISFKKNFISSHSLPPLWFAVSVLQRHSADLLWRGRNEFLPHLRPPLLMPTPPVMEPGGGGRGLPISETSPLSPSLHPLLRQIKRRGQPALRSISQLNGAANSRQSSIWLASMVGEGGGDHRPEVEGRACSDPTPPSGPWLAAGCFFGCEGALVGLWVRVGGYAWVG
jgi:hypothetical protein